MNKFIVKEIKPNQRHKCMYSVDCQEIAECFAKSNNTNKLYLCTKHIATFFKEIGEQTLAEFEGENK